MVGNVLGHMMHFVLGQSHMMHFYFWSTDDALFFWVFFGRTFFWVKTHDALGLPTFGLGMLGNLYLHIYTLLFTHILLRNY